MKKLFTIMVALCATTALWADKVEINGIYYYLVGDSAQVTYRGSSPYVYNTYKGDISIPSSVTYEQQSYRVTSIGSWAFYQCDSLCSISMANSIKIIGDYAFNGCGNLISVSTSNSLTSIGSGAFEGCTSLVAFTIPNSLINIASHAFYECCGFTSITIPNSVKSIDPTAFYNVNNVVYYGIVSGAPWGAKCLNGYVDGYLVYSDATKTKICGCSSVIADTIIVPHSVTCIGDYAFLNCKISAITIPNSVSSMGCYAFKNCSNLPVEKSLRYADTYLVEAVSSSSYYTNARSVAEGEKITTYYIKKGTKWIGERAFYGKLLEKITIPDSVIRIGEYAFMDCSILSSIKIPNSVEYIGYRAFDGCDQLPVENNIRYADIYLIGVVDKKLSSYTIKKGTKWIGSYAFSNCNSVTTITIPNSVKEIETRAFAYCSSLTSIDIPNSVDSIGENAFLSSPINMVNVSFSPFEGGEIQTIIKNAFSKKTTFNKIIQGVASSCSSPTCANVVVDLTDVDVSPYANISIDYGNQVNKLDSGLNTVFITGLKPDFENTLVFRSQLIGSTEWRKGCTLTLQTPKLELTTLQPKVPTAGEAIVCATTNIADAETKAGFEWRKYNAPAELPSSSAYAYVFNGSLQGKIKNLSNEYYKTRAFYEAADGTRYYGEWQTFDPTESSYFDPEVHTYYLPTEPTSKKVTVRGLVTAGTDAIVEQGFEYWPTTAPSAIRRVSNDVKVVHATGQAMTATLDSLNYSTSYECRAFAKTATTTIYGEQISFVTPDDPRPIYTLTLTAGEGGTVQATPDAIYREGDQVTITATANNGFNFVQWSDMITTNPRTIIMDADITLEAIFEAAGQAIDNVNDNLNHNHNKFIRDGILLINRNGIYYNAQGAIVE